VTALVLVEGPVHTSANAQPAAPGGLSGVSLRPRPRSLGDRWPLMFTWTRNKVNWWNLAWRSTELPNSTVYYYEQAEPVARMARTMLVESNRRLQESFDYDLQTFTADKRIPTVIYTSHHTFEQTNTIAQNIPEGLGGFTEFIKGRVVFPYTGSNADFLHVLEHENTHIHMIHKLKHVFKAHRIYDSSKLLPVLWFSEGMGEFESVGYDAASDTHRMDRETEMYVRDAIINGDMPTIRTMRLYPDFARAYKFGHALVQYLGARRGSAHLHEMLSNWHHLFPNRSSYNLLRKRDLDSFDPLNPGVGYLEPAFVRVGNRDVPVVESEEGWLAETAGGLVDSLDGVAVTDRVRLSENIQIEDEWYRIVTGSSGEPAFYRPDRGVRSGWEGETASVIIRREKDRYEERAYKLMSFDRLLEWWYDTDLRGGRGGDRVVAHGITRRPPGPLQGVRGGLRIYPTGHGPGDRSVGPAGARQLA
jgi:hypothetical protein